MRKIIKDSMADSKFLVEEKGSVLDKIFMS